MTKFMEILTTVFVTLASAASGRSSGLPAPMAGSWEGEAQIVVNWTSQRTLAVCLDIDGGGAVTGRVGDALLRKARIRRNRGALARVLHLKTDYVVAGDLEGAIIAAESVRRDGVKIPLNWSGDSFTGGVHTTGWKAGGKDQMILSAAGLRLHRRPATISRRTPCDAHR